MKLQSVECYILIFKYVLGQSDQLLPRVGQRLSVMTSSDKEINKYIRTDLNYRHVNFLPFELFVQ